MRKSRFSEEQIAYALRHAEQGTPLAALSKFYAWKRRSAEMGSPSCGR